MWRSTFKTTIGIAFACGLWAARSETAATPADKPPELGVSAPSAPWTAAWGLGFVQYKEPNIMQLTGPEATLQLRRKAQEPYWTEVLQVDVGVASLHYDSQTTGSMRRVPAFSARGSALWDLWNSEGAAWRAGLQVDMFWTDMRGTSSTGHRGYRRLGSKAWAVLQRESVEGTRAELGLLLQGRQDSLLSDAGINHDISNTQNSGVYLTYQHTPLTELWPGLRPWIRYSQIGRSNIDQQYYEPRNKTLQIGALIDW